MTQSSEMNCIGDFEKYNRCKNCATRLECRAEDAKRKLEPLLSKRRTGNSAPTHAQIASKPEQITIKPVVDEPANCVVSTVTTDAAEVSETCITNEKVNEEKTETPYSFPHFIPELPLKRIQSKSSVELCEWLNKIFDNKVKSAVQYRGINRVMICAIHLELNRRARSDSSIPGTVAPRFREMLRPQYKSEMNEDRTLSLDRQIIDLHWLHCRGVRKNIRTGSENKSFDNLLMDDTFNFSHAEDFATYLGPMEAKINWIRPNEFESWLLATLQSKYMYERYHVICHGEYRKGKLFETGYDQALQLIESSISRSNRRLMKHAPEWALIWKCEKMVGGDSPQILSEIHALATGRDKPLDRSTVKNKLQAAKKHLETERRMIRGTK